MIESSMIESKLNVEAISFSMYNFKESAKKSFSILFRSYWHYDFIKHHRQTFYHFNSLKVESLFQLLWLVPILLPNYHTTNSQTLILSQISRDSIHSLSFLYNITEIVTNKHIITIHKDTKMVIKPKSQKKKKKNTSTDSLKHKHHKHRFWDFEG